MLDFWWAPFTFKGRIGRRIWSLLYLLGGVVGGVSLVVLAALNYNPPNDTITARTVVGFVLLGIGAIVYLVVTVVGLVSTGVRRLHDRGKTGWWLILYYFAPDRLISETSFWQGATIIIPIASGAVLIWGLIDLGIFARRAHRQCLPNPLKETS
jgi:uncharacterized membrane protein YhaH (DUF805 family)